MKNAIKLFMSIKTYLILILMTSCTSLDEKPEDFLSPENYFNNVTELDAVIIGAYNRLTDWDHYGRAFYNIVDLASDDAIVGNFNTARRVEIDFFTLGPENGEIPKVWNRSYESIKACNIVIDQSDKIQSDREKVEQVVGQALFLRALNYFNLVRLYGGVPLIIDSNLDLKSVGDISRSSVEEIYSQIENDLILAEEKLPVSFSDSGAGRATKGAAKTLNAKVLLTEEKWAQAASKAKEVIDLSVYSLVQDYADLWLVQNQNGPEHIFSIQSKALVGVPGRLTKQLLPISAGGNANVLPEVDFYNEFNDQDYRKEVTFMTEFVNDDGVTVPYTEWSVPQPHIGKYKDTGEPANLNGNDTNTNWPVFRYSEVLLIYAEALNEASQNPSSEAYEAINLVRRRAQLSDLQAGLGYEAFRNAVREERRFELCFEGKRWFDIIRWDVLVETLSASRPEVEPHNKLFPIPQEEIDVSNGIIQQNPGY